MSSIYPCNHCGCDVDVDTDGCMDAEGQVTCDACDAKRTAYELRHAHPAPPTSIAEYRAAKGER